MRHNLVIALVALLALAPAASAAPRDKPAAPGAVNGSYIVVYEQGVGSPDAETDRQERSRGFRARHRYRSAIKGFAARLSPGQVSQLRADPDVAFVVPDRPVHALGSVPLALGEPTPPAGVRRIQAATTSTARESATSSVAVIDSGVDLTHPDLNAVSGTNCVTPGASAQDDDGHGTHVAGTIAARNNGSGVVGVAPDTRVYAVKVLDANGDGTWSQVICGIDWVTANAGALGIKVANMSLGGLGTNDRNCGTTNGDALHQAICRSTRAGILHVVAAGNDGWNIGDSPPDVPSSYPEVLTVTAMTDSDGQPGAAGGAPACATGERDDSYASFSNYAKAAADTAHVIAAPGTCIRSTMPGGTYGVMSGTSMASPHVAGAAALCLGEAGGTGPCTGKTPAQVIEHLRADADANTRSNTAYGFAGDPLRPNRWDDYFGFLVRAAPDTTPPETTITSGPSSAISSSQPSFAFVADERGSRFECRVDAGTWASCTSPHTTATLSDGAHTFYVRAIDAAGNVDSSPASRSFTVDTAAPDTSIGSGPSGLTSSSRPAFAFGSPDAGAGFQCRVDAGAWTSCTSPHTTGTLADGAHTFYVRAIDAAGNVDSTPASRSFTVDATAPDTSIGSGPSGGTQDATPTYAFSSADGGASFECRIDNGAWASCTSPHTTGALPDGAHTFYVRATDAAGNVDATPASRSFTVDTVVPDTSIGSGPSSLTSSSRPSFAFGSPESGAGFECRIDNGAWASCTSPHTTATLSDGGHTFDVRATDVAGNVDATPASRSFTVDTVAPETSITSGEEGATKNTTPTYEFTSPEAGAAFECRVDTGPWSACTSPTRTQTLGDGAHTFHVRAKDAAGNPDATPATRSIVVDSSSTTPPRASTEAPSQPAPADSGTSSDPAPSAPADSTTALADTTPPAGTMTVPRQRLRTVARRGLTAKVSCGEACDWRLAVTLERRVAARLGLSRKQLTIGSRSGVFDASGTRTVTVKLTRAARRRLARLRSLRLTVRVELRDAAGHPRVVKRTVTLRR